MPGSVSRASQTQCLALFFHNTPKPNGKITHRRKPPNPEDSQLGTNTLNTIVTPQSCLNLFFLNQTAPLCLGWDSVQCRAYQCAQGLGLA